MNPAHRDLLAFAALFTTGALIFLAGLAGIRHARRSTR